MKNLDRDLDRRPSQLAISNEQLAIAPADISVSAESGRAVCPHTAAVTRGVLALLCTVGIAFTANAVDNEAIARFSAVTNFTTCAQNVRNDMRNAVKKSAADGDFATYDALLALVKKNAGGPVGNATFDIWNDAAWGLFNFGSAQLKKKPAEQKEIIAGFREGGSTFGFWQGADGLEKTPDKAFLLAACNVLAKEMPQENLSLGMQLRRDESILNMHKKLGDKKSKIRAIDTLRNFAVSAKPANQDDTNAVARAMQIALQASLEMRDDEMYSASAKLFREKCEEFLKSRGELYNMELCEAAGYHRAGNKKAYADAIAAFHKHPLDWNVFRALESFRAPMNNFRAPSPSIWKEIERVSDPLIAKRKTLFKGRELMDVLRHMMFVYAGAEDMPAYIAAYKEMEEVYAGIKTAWEEENAREAEARAKEKIAKEKKEPFTLYVRDKSVLHAPALDYPARERGRFIDTLMKNGLEVEAIPYLEASLNPKNPGGYLNLVKIHAKAGNIAEAKKLDAIIQGTNTTATAAQKFSSAAYVALGSAKTPDELVKNLNALRPLSDADGKEGETQVDKDVRFFNKIRAFSRTMFSWGRSEKDVPFLKAIESMTYDMLWAEEKIQYTAKYMPEAPSSAEGAYDADIFKKFPTENRIAMYNVYSQFNKNAELKRIKAADKPHLNADAEGKEAYIVMVYSDNGLHLYGRFNDPNAWKARDGITRGIGFEYSIMPGEDMPWHWNMFNTSDPQKDWGVVWDSPRKNFKVGMEYFREDFCIKQDCHIIHVFFPWAAFPYQLPKNGDTWRLSLIGGWAGQFGALGGGGVHELGRGMQIKFEIPADVQPKLKLALLRQAARDYNNVRDKFENADFWVDPHLGDRDFYDQVAEPFMKELDGVVKQIRETELTAADVDKLLDKYLFDLSDFRLALDAKRADWLRKRFFTK